MMEKWKRFPRLSRRCSGLDELVKMRRYRKRPKIRNKVDERVPQKPGQASRKKSLIPRTAVCLWRGVCSLSTETNRILKKIFRVAPEAPAVHI